MTGIDVDAPREVMALVRHDEDLERSRDFEHIHPTLGRVTSWQTVVGGYITSEIAVIHERDRVIRIDFDND